MDKAKISYAGVGAAVAGVIGILGIYSAWWETDFATYHGTADISGQLALAMSIGLFAFGGAYVLISDARIRRAMGALATLCAVVLTLACVWGLLRTDDVAPGATLSVRSSPHTQASVRTTAHKVASAPIARRMRASLIRT